MQSPNKLFDDLAKVANGAFGAVSGVRNEVEEQIKQRLDRYLSDMDVVPREEFDAVKAMAAKARDENERLEARITALETALKAQKETTATRKTTRKPAPKA